MQEEILVSTLSVDIIAHRLTSITSTEQSSFPLQNIDVKSIKLQHLHRLKKEQLIRSPGCLKDSPSLFVRSYSSNLAATI